MMNIKHETNHPDLNNYSFLLDGSWAKRWKEIQKRPEHLINNESPIFLCTCGYEPKDMLDWSTHATEMKHPWYGPCDALGPDGSCAECEKAL